MIPANLTINADDFGINLKASRWIFRCIQEGLINSISVMPFRCDEQEKLLKAIISDYPQVKVGVHLSLIETDPLIAQLHPGLPPRDYREFLLRYFSGKVNLKSVYAEWKAQVGFVGQFLGGVSHLSHLDSHQHVHVLPGLWQVASRLQDECGIARLRVPYESLRRGLFHQFPFGPALQALAYFRRRHEPTRFIGIFTSMRFTVTDNLKALSQVRLKPDTPFELMVHPGQSPESGNPAIPSDTSLNLQMGVDPEMEELRQLHFFLSPR